MRIFAFTFLLLLTGLASAQTTLKIATLYPPGSDAVKSLQQTALDIRDRTGGDVTLKIYPGGVMGDDSTVLRKIKIRQLHGALLSGSGLDQISPNLKDLSYPFQFDRIDAVYDARETLDTVFRQRLKDQNWLGFGPLDGGFSYLMSQEPLKTLEDVRESKLWLPNTRDIREMAEDLDVDFLAMNISDVLTGLDTGAVDSLIAPPSAAITLNWHSRFDYFTDTPVLYTWGMLALPESAFRSVSDAHRVLVEQALENWSENLDKRLRQANENALAAIRQLLTVQSFNPSQVREIRMTQL